MADWSPLLAAAEAEAARFAKSLADPERSQQALLDRILAANRDCEFGRRHGFAGIATFDDYCANVTVCSHPDIAADISQIALGGVGILTTEPVIAFEETGGTSMGTKLIPYTASGLSDFRRAVLPWLGNLAQRRPALTRGRAYVTISPATRELRRTAAGTLIGLGSDAAYLGEELAPAFGGVLAVPGSVAALADVTDWQVASLTALISAQDLSFVSLWSPTFLTALLAALEHLTERVMAGLDGPARRRLDLALRGPGADTELLWPMLDCISCWNDGPSSAYSAQLAAIFPQAAIEPKGLLATEAAMTVPWGERGACFPAIASCLIEFHDPAGGVHLCHQLQATTCYRLVVTTASGLYRYDMGDLVECTEHVGQVPILRFVGRAGVASDLVGEKLDDGFVARALDSVQGPAVLAAVSDPPGYVLVHETAQENDAAARIEASLSANPQYAYARRMGQLAALRTVLRAELSRDMIRNGLASGKRMGDLKPVALVPPGNGNWLKL